MVGVVVLNLDDQSKCVYTRGTNATSKHSVRSKTCVLISSSQCSISAGGMKGSKLQKYDHPIGPVCEGLLELCKSAI